MPADFKMILGTDGVYDFGIDPVTGDFETEDSFDTAILYSYFGERRALESEVPVSENRRGWQGNEFSDFENGSKTWLFDQARLTTDNLNKLGSEAFNGWEWLLADNLLKDIIIQNGFLNGAGGIFANFVRFDSLVDKRFFTFWDNTGT